MKALEVRVEYGKGGAYVAKDWVAENAVENYTKEWTKRIRDWGWKKEVKIVIRKNVCEINENGIGAIACYTLDGLKTVRVD